ncbi:OsmC family protein [Streptomyces antibioticus]
MGPTPGELLLAALGACTSMTVRAFADRHGWPLDQVDVSVRFDGQGRCPLSWRNRRHVIFRIEEYCGKLRDHWGWSGSRKGRRGAPEARPLRPAHHHRRRE